MKPAYRDADLEPGTFSGDSCVTIPLLYLLSYFYNFTITPQIYCTCWPDTVVRRGQKESYIVLNLFCYCVLRDDASSLGDVLINTESLTAVTCRLMCDRLVVSALQ